MSVDEAALQEVMEVAERVIGQKVTSDLGRRFPGIYAAILHSYGTVKLANATGYYDSDDSELIEGPELDPKDLEPLEPEKEPAQGTGDSDTNGPYKEAAKKTFEEVNEDAPDDAPTVILLNGDEGKDDGDETKEPESADRRVAG